MKHMSKGIHAAKTGLRKQHAPFVSLNKQSFLNCLPFLKALRAYTVKRKILRRAQINVFAVLARKIGTVLK
jgi:hypothetical protein